MGESGLEVAVLDMDDGVEAFAFHVVLQQVEEAVLGIIAFVVVNQAQATIEIGIVPNALLNIFIDVVIVAEKSSIRDELSDGAGI